MHSLLDLTRRYLEPHRTYHNLSHIVGMFTMANDLGLDLSPEQYLAIWYHDAIYVPGSPDNEAASAKLLLEHFGDHRELGSSVSLSKASEMILSTKHHVPRIAGAATVIDLDLAGLGSVGGAYYQNSLLVSQEYPDLDFTAWATGRVAWLKKFLARESIFTTNWGREKFEKQARRNMEEDRVALEAFIEDHR